MAEVKKVVTDGFSTSYAVFGKGDRTLVIIPGLSVQSVMGAADAVENQYKALLDDFTCYLFDRREEVPSEYSVEQMAEDLVTAIKALGLKELHIFGASMGGMMAQEIAINHPDLVSKVVLGSTSSHVKKEQIPLFEKWIRLAKERNSAALYESFGEELYPPAVFAQVKDQFAEMSKTVTEAELDKFIILAGCALDFDITDKLKNIKCPVLAIGDAEDAVLDGDATMEIAENLDYRPDFRLFLYNGFGHAVYDVAPDYLKRMQEFFG